MPEQYLALPREDQADILNALAPTLGRAPEVLEKDVWVCWVLERIVHLPEFAVSKRGFTKPAVMKARAWGIELRAFEESSPDLVRSWVRGPQVNRTDFVINP